MRSDHTIQIHITDACGIDCLHCYIGDQRLKSPQNMSFELFVETVKQEVQLCKEISIHAENEVSPVFHITGGDPLKHPDIWKMLEYLKEGSYKFGLLGNPTSINTLRRLKEYGILSYQISIDGMEEYHNSIRGKGKFKQATSFLAKCKDLDIKSFIIMNVNEHNYKQVIPLYEYLSSLEKPAYSFTFARVAPEGNAKNNFTKDMGIPAKEYRDIFRDIDVTSTKYETKLTMKDPLWSLYLYEENKLKVYNEVYHGGCGAGVSLFSVDIDGRVTPCRRYPIELGNINTDTLEEIFFENSKLHKLRNPEDFSVCGECELFYHCRGCPAISKMGKDPQCWR